MTADAILDPTIGFVTVEKENTYGTDPDTSPVALMLVEAPDVPDGLREQVMQNAVKHTTGGLPHAVVKNKCEFSMQVYVAPLPFEDGAVPAIAPILVGSGFQETSQGSTSSSDVEAVYDPDPLAQGSYTVKFYRKDKKSPTNYSKITITGCRSNVTFNLQGQNRVTVDVSGEGLYAEWTPLQDFASEEPAEYHGGETPFVANDWSIAMGSISDICTNFSFSTNLQLNSVDQATADTIANEILLTVDRDQARAGGSFDPLAQTVGATDDALDHDRNATVSALDVDLVKSAKEWHFSAPAAQIGENPFEEGSGQTRYGTAYECNEDAGDDDYQISWKRTAA